MFRQIIVLILLFSVIHRSIAWAQLQVIPAADAAAGAALVNSVLVAGGQSLASNVTCVGAFGNNASIGQFTVDATGPNIGFTSGILMSTGRVQDQTIPCTGPGFSPPNANNATASTGLGLAGDANLAAIVAQNNACSTGNNGTFDATSLTFSFTPTTDTIRFRYVFASEEYNQYVFTTFNDIFAFFLSGPNPEGGNFVNKNIALIPGTNIPVSINNINNGSPNGNGGFGSCPSGPQNPQFFINNSFCTASNLNYNAYTVPLTAVSAVVPCSTYTLKLVIADVGDGVLDSGVFLEANSFEGLGLDITSSGISIENGKKYIGEGCGTGQFQIFRGKNLDQDQNVSFQIDLTNSTATLGQDYTLTGATVNAQGQGNVNFQAGQFFQFLDIEALTDTELEEDEYIIISLPEAIGCGGGVVNDTLYIRDNKPFSISLTTPEPVCAGLLVSLEATVTGGFSPYVYTWYANNTFVGSGNPLTIPALTQNTVYELRITDACGQTSVGSTVEAKIIQPNPQQITPTYVLPPTVSICVGQSITLSVQASGGTEQFQYQWNTSANDTLPTLTVTPGTTTSYTVTVSDGCSPLQTLVSTVVVSGPITATAGGGTTICFGNQIQLSGTATGGNGTYTYLWRLLPNGSPEPGQNITVSPAQTSSYELTVTDNCASPLGRDTVTVNVNPPLSIVLAPSFRICAGESVTLSAQVQGGDTEYTYQWQPAGPNAPSQSVSPAQDQTYTLTVTDNCGSPAVSTTVFVRVVPQSTADFAFAKPTICLDERAVVNFTGSTNPGAQAVWDFGSFTPQAGQGLGPYQLRPSSTGTQEISLFLVQEGCTTATIRRSVEVVEVPIAQFTAPDNQCLTGNSFSFQPSLPQNTLYTYTWRFNNGMQPATVTGFAANGIQADTAGTYVAELEVRLGDCADIARRSFKVHPTPPPIVAFTDSICSGFQARLTVLETDETKGLTFEWFNRPDADQPVFRGPVYTTPRLDSATTFYVQGRSRFGCISLNRTAITAGVRYQEPIRLEAQSRVVYLPQAVISLTGNVTDPNVVAYYWTVGDRFTYTTPEPVFTLGEPGLYRVSLTTLDAFGCLNTVIENDFIEVREVFPLEIPNAFSPNGDLNNDELWVRGANIMDFEFQVFNRMGNVVFATRDLNFRWNGRSESGTELQEGVYIYYVRGRTYKGVPFERSGSITLIR